MRNSGKQENGILVLLRVCTFLLAAVSFWTTASGMADYVFPKGWQPYAASLGIQGLLLGLNFSLPQFMQKSKGLKQKTVLMILTVVVLFCSSWFSYLFIAEKAYESSWDRKRQLEAQAIYREQLFNAEAYVEQYSEELSEALTKQLLELYGQAVSMDEKKVDVIENLNWEEERDNYAAPDSAARDHMQTVINAMEQAAAYGATPTVRAQTAEVLSRIQDNIQDTMNAFEAQSDRLEARLAAAGVTVENARNNLNSASEDTDREPLQRAYQRAIENYEARINELNDLEKERSDYQNADRRISYYKEILGIEEEGVSTYFVGANLREIQVELYASSPDVDKMQQLALEIFERLQNGSDLETEQQGNMSYQDFLTKMNSFVSNLENYRSLKVARKNLQTRADRLTAGINEDKKENWPEQYEYEYEGLKAQISGLPVYTLSGEDTGSSAAGNFDRGKSVRKLDEAIQRYLTVHNNAEKGMIYLFSPYRALALFSLALAFMLDIAAFVTGVIIHRVESSKGKSEEEEAVDWLYMENENVQGSIPGLNEYLFLTGDYMNVDGVVTYKVIKNGEITELIYSQAGCASGFYRWKEQTLWTLGESKLLYKGEKGGPQDGIYADSVLDYYNGALTIKKKGETEGEFVGNVSPYIPVYAVENDSYDVFPAHKISAAKGKEIVIALDTEGTQIVAIYVIS